MDVIAGALDQSISLAPSCLVAVALADIMVDEIAKVLILSTSYFWEIDLDSKHARNDSL